LSKLSEVIRDREICVVVFSRFYVIFVGSM
jgi:hypothetical protein